MSKHSRWVATLLAVAGVAAVAAVLTGVAIMHFATWRSVAFLPLERPFRAAWVLVGGLLLLGGAAWLRWRPRRAAKVVVGVAAGLALFAGCAGVFDGASVQAAADERLSPSRDIVASSADGRFQVVKVWPSADVIRYRFRTRGWLSGREGKLDFACTLSASTRPDYDAPRQGSSLPPEVPTVRVKEVGFADEHRVALRMTDGTTWTVGFNADTLRPDRSLSWCGPNYKPQ